MLCIEKAQKDEFRRPCRFTFPATDCGFIFVPADPEWVAHPDWPTMRVRGLCQFVEAHKTTNGYRSASGFLWPRMESISISFGASSPMHGERTRRFNGSPKQFSVPRIERTRPLWISGR